jgi:type I restriction enzyme, S subunit
MSNMNWLPFDKVITDSTSNYYKIKKEDYLNEGFYKIIDQGQTFLGGYTNNKDLITDDNIPVIVFGDHTRILKYIDFPFAIGADGVKVLRINKEIAEPRYIYYFLKSIKITEAGYSRHFKFLKEIKIPIQNLEDQIRIANILSKSEALISQRKESLRLLDELLKSTFLEMFGDPIKNPKGWDIKLFGDVIESIRYGTSTPPEYKTEGIPFIRATNVKKGRVSKKDLVFISESEAAKIPKCKIKEGDLIIVRSGANTGDAVTIPKEFNNAYAAYDLIITLNRISSIFYNELINSEFGKTKIKPLTQRSGQPHLNSDQVKNLKFYYPPIKLQTQFAHIVEKTEALKVHYQTSLQELENLYGSLSQRAFSPSVASAKGGKRELNVKEKEYLYINAMEDKLAMAAEPEVKYKKHKIK